MEIKVLAGNIAEIKVDAVLVSVFEGVACLEGAAAGIDRALDGAVAQLISQGEIKGFLNTWRDKAKNLDQLFLLVETAAHDLNHKSRRSLGGRTSCQCYFGNNRMRYSKWRDKWLIGGSATWLLT